MIIHWIRHTTPDVASGVCYGQTDLDVVDSFAEEVLTVRSKLLDQYDRVYSSPLQRCSKLAEACLEQPAILDPRVMEYNFGDWEMLKWDELKGMKAQQWFDDFVNKKSPNGESMKCMQRRVFDFYRELIESNVDSIAVFTHSGVQRIIHAKMLDTPLQEMFQLQLGYGEVLESAHSHNDESATITRL